MRGETGTCLALSPLREKAAFRRFYPSGTKMDPLIGAFRFALRSFRRNLDFTLVVVITIAIAIGSTTTMLSVVNAALVRPAGAACGVLLATSASGISRATS